MTDQTPSDVTAHGAQRIKIFDTTLRDGEQSPGFTMNAAQKVLFAHAREELGVDVIEAGFPNSSPADFGAVVAFLCSAQARFVTGASLPVDGGAYRGLQ